MRAADEMGDSDISDKGYEIGGLPVWYHPYRVDVWRALGDVQRANLRARMRDEQEAVGGDISEEAIDKLYRVAEYADRRKCGDTYSPMFLHNVRKHHVENGGIVFDMAGIGHHLEVTWADGITLRNVYPWATAIYVHFGSTLEYDQSNPASLIEGVYINHTDTPTRGWLLTFVTNYPDWESREHHMPGTTLRNFNRFIAITIPEDEDIAKLDYGKLKIVGDKELAKQADLWHLARLGTNAMLYLSRARPALQATMSMFRAETSDTNKTQLYECGADEIDLGIDWSNTSLAPGRWVIDDPGGEGRYLVTRWIPPKVVRPQERERFMQEGGKILEFRAQKR